MRSYSETHIFKPEELDLLQRAIVLVDKIPDIDGLRCHEVARVIGHILELQVQDGHYGSVEHSWLWIKRWVKGTYPPNILDVYCVGSLPQVRLVDMSSVGIPHMNTGKKTGYRPGEQRKDANQALVISILQVIR